MSKMKHAVSLIVLVVTILVLSILAAAVIISLSNANIMGGASQTVFKQDMANYKETYEVYVTNRLANNPEFDRTELFATYISDEELFIEIFGEVPEKYQAGLKIIEGRLVYDTEDEVEIAITKELAINVPNISKEKSYVGYFADVDGDGEADGVIFADLAVGKTTDQYLYSSSEDKDMLKDYVICKMSYTVENCDGYGKKPVIQLAKGQENKEDRFYVMALEDFKLEVPESSYSSLMFCWYSAAWNKGIKNLTPTEFETGKSNTQTMIESWNCSECGKQNNNNSYADMWGVIQEKVYGKNYNKENKTKDDVEWFVPSRAEWFAFFDNLKINKSNYSEHFGLVANYWTSSTSNKFYVYYTNIITGGMTTRAPHYTGYVRLAAIF